VGILQGADLTKFLLSRGYKVTFNLEARSDRYLFKKDKIVILIQEANPLFTIGPYVFRFKSAPLDRGGLDVGATDFIRFTNVIERTEARWLAASTANVPPTKTNQIEKVIAQVKTSIWDTISKEKLPNQLIAVTNSGRIDRIFIDPGHGGADPGAIAYGFQEKDLALKISKGLRDSITNRVPNVPVEMLRDKDDYVSLEDRCREANKKLRHDQNGLFISLHLNTWLDPEARGFEVYYMAHQDWSERARMVALMENRNFNVDKTNIASLNPFEKIFGRLETIQFQKESKMIAENVSFSVFNQVKDYAVNRGVKAETFFVLKGVLMPSILIEVGFVSSKADLEYLNDDEKIKKVQDAIAKGLEQYIEDFNDSKGFTEQLF
jgi:N-acetylmuramoyl-L-alanine amidase